MSSMLVNTPSRNLAAFFSIPLYHRIVSRSIKNSLQELWQIDIAVKGELVNIQGSNEWDRDIADAEKIGNYYEVSTTALDHNNDFLQLYIRQDGNRITFSDDGDTLSALESEGVSLSPKVREGIAETLRQYDAKLEGDVLTAESSMAEYPQAKKRFMQAMMATDKLFEE